MLNQASQVSEDDTLNDFCFANDVTSSLTNGMIHLQETQVRLLHRVGQ